MAHVLHPDLIVTDLMMPEMVGFQVIEHLKADPDLRHVPVIVLTAKDLTPDERQRLTGRIVSLLQKGSFLNDELLQRILETLT
jgi:threonine synthase